MKKKTHRHVWITLVSTTRQVEYGCGCGSLKTRVRLPKQTANETCPECGHEGPHEPNNDKLDPQYQCTGCGLHQNWNGR